MKLEITSVNAIIYNLGREFTIVKLSNTNSYYKKLRMWMNLLYFLTAHFR